MPQLDRTEDPNEKGCARNRRDIPGARLVVSRANPRTARASAGPRGTSARRRTTADRRLRATMIASATGHTGNASWSTMSVRETGTESATRSTTAAKPPIRIARTPAKMARCPTRYASDSIKPVTPPNTVAMSAAMNATRYTNSAKIESRLCTID